MTTHSPSPGDLRALAKVIRQVARVAARIDWSGLDIEPVDSDLQLIARDLTEVSEELRRDLDEAAAFSRAIADEKRDDRHREELDELRDLIGARA